MVDKDQHNHKHPKQSPSLPQHRDRKGPQTNKDETSNYDSSIPVPKGKIVTEGNNEPNKKKSI